jgi:hypothetical protein
MFLTCIGFLLLALSIEVWVVLIQFQAGSMTWRERGVLAIGQAVTMLLVMTPFLFGGQLDLDYIWPLWCFGCAGLLAVASAAYRLFRSRHHATFLSTGLPAVILFFGVYLLFVTFDQAVFFLSMPNVGFMNIEDEKDALDVQCPRLTLDQYQYLVVKDYQTRVATYRCPKPAAVIFGRYTATPIIPWPDYIEGTSQEVPKTIRRWKKEAHADDDERIR